MSDSEDVSDEAMGGLEDDESSSEESLSNFFCEDWVPKQKLPCLFCFKNNVNFPLVSHNRPTMPSQELSAELSGIWAGFFFDGRTLGDKNWSAM